MRSNTSHPSNTAKATRKGELSGINASAVDAFASVNSALSGTDGTVPRFLSQAIDRFTREGFSLSELLEAAEANFPGSVIKGDRK